MRPGQQAPESLHQLYHMTNLLLHGFNEARAASPGILGAYIEVFIAIELASMRPGQQAPESVGSVVNHIHVEISFNEARAASPGIRGFKSTLFLMLILASMRPGQQAPESAAVWIALAFCLLLQ